MTSLSRLLSHHLHDTKKIASRQRGALPAARKSLTKTAALPELLWQMSLLTERIEQPIGERVITANNNYNGCSNKDNNDVISGRSTANNSPFVRLTKRLWAHRDDTAAPSTIITTRRGAIHDSIR